MLTAVVAIGGNSLVRAGERATIQTQRRNLETTCEGIAALLARGYRVVITHGNGPQVGDALLRSELAAAQVEPQPLDVCVAETQGSIGYLLQQVLQTTLGRRRLSRPVVTLVTQVLVSTHDPAFRHPSKPVGPFLNREKAEQRRSQLGWEIVEDAKRGYRRVVPSPEPKAIIELMAVERTLDAGAVAIACGGGGVPVILQDCELVGIEAVIDKDRASSLLASQLGANLLLISTSVDQVSLHYGTAKEQPLSKLSPVDALRYLSEGHFAPGSMGPKIEAALNFLEHGGERVVITSPEGIPAALDGHGGTRVEPASRPTPRTARVPT